MSHGTTLDEYENRGAYHRDLKLSRAWLPRYFRRFHVACGLFERVVSKDATIVDVGGGEGIFVDRLVGAGFGHAVAVDPYAPDGTEASDRLLRGGATDLPFDDDSVDAFSCLDVLEHIPLNVQEPAAVEILRVLRPGGVGIVSVPNMAHLRSRLTFLSSGRPWRNRLDKHPGELAAAERVGLFERAGFEVVDEVGLHLTLSLDPRPAGPFGRILSHWMFRPTNPPRLCWTFVFAVRKPGANERIVRPLESVRLSGILRSYEPGPEDPTRTR